jgi:mRNA interferase HigB
MRVIARKRLMDFATKHPDARGPLDAWCRTVRKAVWANLQDVRRIFPHADAVRVASGNTVTVFNIAGNKYRLAAAIHYNAGRLYVLRIMTHAEYDKGTWKETL